MKAKKQYATLQPFTKRQVKQLKTYYKQRKHWYEVGTNKKEK